VTLQVIIDSETIARIDAGPLALTGGKGRAAWARTLILHALDEYEGIASEQGRRK
jgi:hypothetical protein